MLRSATKCFVLASVIAACSDATPSELSVVYEGTGEFSQPLRIAGTLTVGRRMVQIGPSSFSSATGTSAFTTPAYRVGAGSGTFRFVLRNSAGLAVVTAELPVRVTENSTNAITIIARPANRTSRLGVCVGAVSAYPVLAPGRAVLGDSILLYSFGLSRDAIC